MIVGRGVGWSILLSLVLLVGCVFLVVGISLRMGGGADVVKLKEQLLKLGVGLGTSEEGEEDERILFTLDSYGVLADPEKVYKQLSDLGVDMNMLEVGEGESGDPVAGYYDDSGKLVNAVLTIERNATEDYSGPYDVFVVDGCVVLQPKESGDSWNDTGKIVTGEGEEVEGEGTGIDEGTYTDQSLHSTEFSGDYPICGTYVISSGDSESNTSTGVAYSHTDETLHSTEIPVESGVSVKPGMTYMGASYDLSSPTLKKHDLPVTYKEMGL